MQGPLRLKKRGGNKSSPTRGDDSRSRRSHPSRLLNVNRNCSFQNTKAGGEESQSESAPPGNSAQPADTIHSTLTQQHAHRLRSGYLPEAKVPVLHVRYGKYASSDSVLRIFIGPTFLTRHCGWICMDTGVYMHVPVGPCMSLYVPFEFLIDRILHGGKGFNHIYGGRSTECTSSIQHLNVHPAGRGRSANWPGG